MVLTDLCVKCDMDFALAHCNFGLRGTDSDGDEKFVNDLANRLNKKVYSTSFNTGNYITENKVSVQMAARALRYDWFAEIMQKTGIKTLVTAHHADDNLETFLINLSRGTGVDGLMGIPEKNKGILRPMLVFSRRQIETYAERENIRWREDLSNADTKYLRNDIRHKIVPLLKGLNPNFLDNFQETQTYLAQTAVIANTHIRQMREDVFQWDGDIITIPIADLVDLNPLKGYIYGLFSDYGFTEWDDVEHLLTATSGKEVRSKTHRLIKDREYLILAEITPSTDEIYQIEENEAGIDRPFSMDIKVVHNIWETAPHILYVPKKALKYPLTLRKWRQGDYFYPFGMKGKKKLSKFFKDEKLDAIAKQNQWLLCSAGAIVWVVGRRADDRFKVTEGAEKIIKFELK